jgi:hypothetical protein
VKNGMTAEGGEPNNFSARVRLGEIHSFISSSAPHACFSAFRAFFHEGFKTQRGMIES